MRALALGLSLLLLATACNPLGTADDERVLTILYWQAATLPGPYLSAGTKDTDAGAITLEPLAIHDPDGVLVPRLAVEIPTLANGGVAPDLTAITWTLREGLKWSDGSELTAHDVVFTWRYCADEATGCTEINLFDGIASVEAVDRLTVRITFEAPTPYPYTAFVGASSPIISSAQFLNCVGAAAVTCEEQNHAPLGSGPYRITDFVPNERAEYERNPHYRGAPPYFDRVVLRGGGDALTAARAVLEEGEADYAWNLQLRPSQLARLEIGGPGAVVSSFASDVERIVVNQTNPDPALGEDRSEYLDGANPHPFLTYPPIPRAMSMAIDRRLIAQRLYGFAGAPVCNLIAGPARYVSRANDDCLTQDIAGANRLLDESGVLDTDGDGIREHEGVPLRVVYQTSTNEVRQETQALIREWWRLIGIETDLVDHDSALFFGGDPVGSPDESLRRFFADVQMYTTGPSVDPQEHLSGQRCIHIQSRENFWGDNNVARACNPEYDALYERLAATPVGPEREELVKQLNDLVVRNHYQIPLVRRANVSGRSASLRGVRMNAWDSELWNIAEWRR